MNLSFWIVFFSLVINEMQAMDASSVTFVFHNATQYDYFLAGIDCKARRLGLLSGRSLHTIRHDFQGREFKLSNQRGFKWEISPQYPYNQQKTREFVRLRFGREINEGKHYFWAQLEIYQASNDFVCQTDKEKMLPEKMVLTQVLTHEITNDEIPKGYKLFFTLKGKNLEDSEMDWSLDV